MSTSHKNKENYLVKESTKETHQKLVFIAKSKLHHLSQSEAKKLREKLLQIAQNIKALSIREEVIVTQLKSILDYTKGIKYEGKQ